LLNHLSLSVAEKIYFQPVIKKPIIPQSYGLKTARMPLIEKMLPLIIDAHSKYIEFDL
jgi:hypothetical protein